MYLPSGSFAMPCRYPGDTINNASIVTIGHAHQNGGSETSVRAGGFDLTFQPEAFANNIASCVRISPGCHRSVFAAARKTRRSACPAAERGGEVRHRHFEGRAQVLLVEQRAEFLAQRLRQLLTEHLQTDGESVSGAHGSRQKSSASGNCASSLFNRLVRVRRTYKYGKEPKMRAPEGRGITRSHESKAKPRSAPPTPQQINIRARNLVASSRARPAGSGLAVSAQSPVFR